MRKTLLLSTVALTVCAFAEQNLEQHELVAAAKKNGIAPVTPPPPAPTSTEVRPGYPTVNPQPTLTSARAKSEYGGYVFADLLYWHADVSNTDWAGKNKDTSTGFTQYVQDDHQMKFKWDWAFRVGVGMDLQHDQWDTNFYYTWFQTDISNSAGTKTGQSITVLNNFDATLRVSQGKNRWKIHYNMFDMDLGRWFYVSNSLALRPHLGLKGGWIHQKYHSFWDQQIPNKTYQQEFKNNFWGIGASGGINSQWTLAFYRTNAFNLFCDLAGALMYGRFGISFNQKFYTGDQVTTNYPINHLDRHLVVPMLQAMLGFGWDTPLYTDRYHVGVKLGYEFQYWFRQLHKISKIQPFGIRGATISRYSLRADPLALQGLTLDFCFDY